MWRIIFAIPCWIAYQLFIFIPLMLLGWVMVPIAAACGAYKKVQDKDGAGNPRAEYHFTWPFMFVWDNVEDGVANDTYVNFKSMFMKIVYWSCFRNPVNNLRITPLLSCKINGSKVRFYGSFGSVKTPLNELQKTIMLYDTKVPQWFFAYQNIWHSNFYWQFNAFGKLWRFWLGNCKVYPTDILFLPLGYREKGSGPVAQFKRVKI
jgi:hypothetical protein